MNSNLERSDYGDYGPFRRRLRSISIRRITAFLAPSTGTKCSGNVMIDGNGNGIRIGIDDHSASSLAAAEVDGECQFHRQ